MAKKEVLKEASLQEIVGNVAAGKYHPIYFFMGEEPYFIDFLTDFILSHLPLNEEEKTFDLNILYGTDDMSAGKIISLARSYPMLAKYQVVVVREAQKIKNLEEALTPYVMEPFSSTILIVNYKGKTVDKRRKLASELAEHAVVFTSNKLKDDQIPSWIIDFLRGMGLQIELKAAQMLSDFLGTDLGRIVGELNKLKLVMPAGQTTITPELIERNIGISKDFNSFELIDAIKTRDISKALFIAGYFAKNPKENPIQLTTSVVFDFFAKLLVYHYLVDKSPYSAASKIGVYPKYLKDYETASKMYSVRKTLENIGIVREFDARSKGFGQPASEDGELLREMLCRLMNERESHI